MPASGHFTSLTYSTPSVALSKVSFPSTNDIVGVSHFFVSTSVPSTVLNVPNPLHGSEVLYACNALSGTINVAYSIHDSSKALLLVSGTSSARHVTVSSFLHAAKADEPILFIPVPIVMDTRPLLPSKALNPMFVTELGMVTDVRPLQLPYLQIALYQRFTNQTAEKC